MRYASAVFHQHDWELALDLTRLLARCHLDVPRGIDRVELEYARRAVVGHPPFARYGRPRFIAHIHGEWREVPFVVTSGLVWWLDRRWSGRRARFSLRTHRRRVRDLLRFALRVSRPFTPLQPLVYLNVGHKSLVDISALRRSTTAPLLVVVMVHDAMPVTHPSYFPADTRRQFEEWLTIVAHEASLVLATSQSARGEVVDACSQTGHAPDVAVIALGVQVALAQETHSDGRPYFVCVGAIEKRKNIDLLSRIWDELSTLPDPPILHLIGNVDEAYRGHRFSPRIEVHSDLGDRELAAYLAGARALLFPSHAEGFGLPLLEAMSAGVPVIASKLPVFEELGGGVPLLIDVDDVEGWTEAVESFLVDDGPRATQLAKLQGWRAPSWNAHFEALGVALNSLMEKSSKHNE
jgi:glycosyltransferase involved in cell wall biosynthesis